MKGGSMDLEHRASTELESTSERGLNRHGLTRDRLTRRVSVSTGACLGAILATLLFVGGCGSRAKNLPDKAPRPVEVMTLYNSTPTGSYTLSGAVQSWKTEKIGFEVDGRVLWVLEPGKDVEGRITGDETQFLKEGTPLAQIDPSRYEVAAESAKANLEVAILTKEGIEIRLSDSLLAEKESAKADLKLAEEDFKRMEELIGGNAVSRAQYDQANARLQTQQARIKSIEADTKQAEADLKSAEAQVKVAEQALRDAERDLDNTTLYSAFRGRVSDVHVVPGSVVSVGAPVLTLQMMNPIKVEVEVSAEKSREVRRRSQIPVSYKLPNGSMKTDNAFVYNVDTSADPTTRTFSLTLLVLNEQYRQPRTGDAAASQVAMAMGIWPLFVNRIVGAPEDISIIEEKSIREDELGHYVYQVMNAQLGDAAPEVLEVAKHRVTRGTRRISFLGIWTFREVQFAGSPPLSPTTMIVGELDEESAANPAWNRDKIVIDSGAQWVLRPGDLVSVNLSGRELHSGFYVPANAIYEQSGVTSLFVVEDDVVRKIKINALVDQPLTSGPLVEVQSPDLTEGMQVVLNGVHYLNDGDRVQIVARTDGLSSLQK